MTDMSATPAPRQRRYLVPGCEGYPLIYVWGPGMTDQVDEEGNFQGPPVPYERALTWDDARLHLKARLHDIREYVDSLLAEADSAGPQLAVVDTRYRDPADAETINAIRKADPALADALVAEHGPLILSVMAAYLDEHRIPQRHYRQRMQWAVTAYKGVWDSSTDWVRDFFAEMVNEATSGLAFGLDWAQILTWRQAALMLQTRGQVEYLEFGERVAVFDLTQMDPAMKKI
jgi:hypothetical protein